MPSLAPPPLQPGQRVALVATARKISADEVAFAVNTLCSWGLEVVLGESIGAASHIFAGPDELRRRDLQRQLDDPGIHGIICARGGYGTARLVDELDFSQFARQPKWVAGFSDITVLNCHLLRLGYQSIHGVMPSLWGQADGETAVASLRAALEGAPQPLAAPPHPLNRPGTATAELAGGNLSLLDTITATSSQVSFEGRILFLEDIDEYLYRIDRMLLHLRRSGQLARLAGLVVGHFTAMQDNDTPFGHSAYELVGQHVSGYDFPVAYGLPIGHEPANHAVVVGRPGTLVVDTTEARLAQ